MADTLTDKALGEMTAGSFWADLSQFLNHREFRLREGSSSPIRSSTEYKHSDTIIRYKLEALKNKLPAEMRMELIDLCEEHIHMENISNSLYYRQGFSDGVKMILQSIMLS